MRTFVHETDLCQRKFFPMLNTLAECKLGSSTNSTKQNKTNRSKSQQDFLDSKCSLRTCVLRLRTNHFGLFRLHGRWVKVRLSLFFQVRPSLQLEQATHTALKAWKHWQMFRRTSNQIPIQMTCNFYVGESLRTPSLVLFFGVSHRY